MHEVAYGTFAYRGCDRSEHLNPRGISEIDLMLYSAGDEDLVASRQYFIAHLGQKLSLRKNAGKEFQELANKWQKETSKLSMMQPKVAHPLYLRMVGMGPKALPHIFRELRLRPSGSWLPALEAIVGENVAKDATTIEQAISRWLKWAVTQNLD
ncbi:MAG: hypothetical protein KA746_05490 [Pyrinomonadaceae bacterium]|nr:hypothetical protein [Pyrinomonadaceae bacterium]